MKKNITVQKSILTTEPKAKHQHLSLTIVFVEFLLRVQKLTMNIELCRKMSKETVNSKTSVACAIFGKKLRKREYDISSPTRFTKQL